VVNHERAVGGFSNVQLHAVDAQGERVVKGLQGIFTSDEMRAPVGKDPTHAESYLLTRSFLGPGVQNLRETPCFRGNFSLGFSFRARVFSN
jgi:hypothetical protein